MKKAAAVFRRALFWGALFFFCVFRLAAQTRELFPDAPALGSRAAVVMDATTGELVFYKNPDDEIPPASLTKLMTMHLAFREIEAGRASLDEIITPPRESWAVNQLYASSLMNIARGQTLTLRQILLGMALPSGNDAAAAAALRFAPSVAEFVEMMNREAAALGFEKTRFVDASGYSEKNMTTAREFAEFCRFYLEAHPESLEEYHAVRVFPYPLAENVPEAYRERPNTINHRNHNHLLDRVEGVDGLKTGFIPESGYNIALTAERGGSRFIAVILGAPSEWGGDRIRDEDGEKLLNWVFDHYKTVRPEPPEIPAIRVWKGKANYVNLLPAEDLRFTSTVDRAQNLYWEAEVFNPLIAPLPSGTQAGDLVLYDQKGELRRIPLVTETEVQNGGFFKRLFDSIRLFFGNIGRKR